MPTGPLPISCFMCWRTQLILRCILYFNTTNNCLWYPSDMAEQSDIQVVWGQECFCYSTYTVLNTSVPSPEILSSIIFKTFILKCMDPNHRLYTVIEILSFWCRGARVRFSNFYDLFRLNFGDLQWSRKAMLKKLSQKLDSLHHSKVTSCTSESWYKPNRTWSGFKPNHLVFSNSE